MASPIIRLRRFCPRLRKLTRAMDKTKGFFDPLIVVAADGMYWTPNGNHRLTALRELGAKSIVALVMPEPEVAYQILALNTEKAHSLRERAQEVVRMYRELAGVSPRKETDCIQAGVMLTSIRTF
jgi:ParB family chromosome partitioning protein